MEKKAHTENPEIRA